MPESIQMDLDQGDGTPKTVNWTKENYPAFALPQIEAHQMQLENLDYLKKELDHT
ncbi:hypothetical protein B9479_005432, partial [Cryptococcus floricola]